MKTLLLALSCSLAIVLPGHAQTSAGTSPAKAAKSGRAIASTKTETPRIEGVVVPRGELGFLGVQIVGGSFKISFYNKAKAPVAADVGRALLRWDPKYKAGQERVVLNLSEDGKSLSAPRAIRPPYVFKLFITLMKTNEGEDKAVETHVIDFRA